MIFPLFNKWKNLQSYFTVMKSVYESDLVIPLISSGQPKSDDIDDHELRD